MSGIPKLGWGNLGFLNQITAVPAAIKAGVDSIVPDLPPVPKVEEPPPPPPDLADPAVLASRDAARRRAASGGLDVNFLSGPLGDTSAPATKVPSIIG